MRVCSLFLFSFVVLFCFVLFVCFGCYTRMLRVVQNISWNDFVNNHTLYWDLPKVTATLRVKHLRFAGHIWRGNEVAKELLFWEPTQGSRSRGRPAITYVDQLLSDTGLSKRDIQRAMENREMWKRVMKWNDRASSTWSCFVFIRFFLYLCLDVDSMMSLFHSLSAYFLHVVS